MKHSQSCLAVEVLRRNLDTATGHLPLADDRLLVAVWAAELVDMALDGAVTLRSPGNLTGVEPSRARHPVVRAAARRLARRTPVAMSRCFAAEAVDLHRECAAATRWMVDHGLWTRRRGPVWTGPLFTDRGGDALPLGPGQRPYVDVLVDMAGSQPPDVRLDGAIAKLPAGDAVESLIKNVLLEATTARAVRPPVLDA